MSSKGIPDPSFLVSTFRGMRNGIWYGGRLRFMHALVMTALFNKGNWKTKLRTILQLTYEHAKNLGVYVFLYKAGLYILQKATGKKEKWHSFVSGFMMGYIVFGKKTNVNYQIVLYLLSRIITGGINNLVNKGKLPDVSAYPVMAAVCWGVVMWLFEDDSKCLQPSLSTTMQFLYKDSDTYRDWTDFVPITLPDSVTKFVNGIIEKGGLGK